MGIDGIEQPIIIDIDDKLRIRKPKKEEWQKSLEWYKNEKVMYYSEGVQDRTYKKEDINRMYSYLSKIGELYFIEIYEGRWLSIGDVVLSDRNLPIVIGEERYWGLGIGRKVVNTLLKRAKKIGINSIRIPEIYHYNDRSRRLFESLGFIKCGETKKGESYIVEL